MNGERKTPQGKQAGAEQQGPVAPSSFIRTMTVGSGIAPDLLTFHAWREALAGSRPGALTAGGESHPALKTFMYRSNRRA